MTVAQSLDQLIATPTKTAKEIYQENGVIVLKHLLNRDEVLKIRKAFAYADQEYTWGPERSEQGSDKKYPRIDNPHRETTLEAGRLVAELLFDSRFYGTVEDLLGPSYAAQSMYFLKPPHARGQAYHQDNWFLNTHPDTCLAAWIALDDCDDDNGGLRVIPGTHKYPVMCHKNSADMDLSFNEKEVSVDPTTKSLQAVMDAGDVLFFHGSIVHMSLPNASKDRTRRSLVFHYIPQSSKNVNRYNQPLLSSDGSTRYIEVSEGKTCVDGEIA